MRPSVGQSVINLALGLEVTYLRALGDVVLLPVVLLSVLSSILSSILLSVLSGITH